MSRSCCTDPNGLSCGGDPARGGSPFTRLSYNYGMLLGAEDFLLEQRAHLWRTRLHNALLHGAGTVYGLRVDLAEDGRLRVAPGLALDPRGRELFVDKALCLDVRGLSANYAFWSTLGARGGKVWVVLRYEACQGEPVPAIQPTCAEPGSTETYSRIHDRCIAEIVAEEPATPLASLRAWLGRAAAGDPGPGDARWLGTTPGSATDARKRLLELLTGPAEHLDRLWTDDTPVPVVLASLELELGEGGLAQVKADSIDNDLRPILPAVQLVAEQLFGTELTRDPGPRGTVGVTAVRFAGGAVEVDLSGALDPATKDTGAELLRWTGAAWTVIATSNQLNLPGTTLRVTPVTATDLSGPDPVQLLLFGAGPRALLGANKEPFGGDALEPNPLNRSRDLAVAGTWSLE